MPFEAGIAYAAHISGTIRRPHHVLLLDSAPYRYQASLSDAAGLDPKIHHGQVIPRSAPSAASSPPRARERTFQGPTS
jgi:hypothetical protein